jgi:aryl-alcohol dehydrogenase-like predicted oxidoreductase
MDYSEVSGLRLSKICFGCEALGGSSDCGTSSIPDIESAIHGALDLGINFFDTADVYGLGLSESRLSNILGEKRHDLVIATKVGVAWEAGGNARAWTWRDSSPAYVRLAVENSLRRLRLDCIPILYSHWPDSATSIEKTFETFRQLKEEGKILLIGCSNYELHELEKIIKITPISLLQIPLNILMTNINPDLVSFCKVNKIKIITYNTLANGLLTGKFTQDKKFDASDRRSRLPIFQGEQYLDALRLVGCISILAKKEKLTLAQYAIKWNLAQPCVISSIVGIKSITQLNENIAFDLA